MEVHFSSHNYNVYSTDLRVISTYFHHQKSYFLLYWSLYKHYNRSTIASILSHIMYCIMKLPCRYSVSYSLTTSGTFRYSGSMEVHMFLGRFPRRHLFCISSFVSYYEKVTESYLGFVFSCKVSLLYVCIVIIER